MFALESNPDLSFAQGTQCRETQRNRTHEPGSCKKRSGGVAPAWPFLAGRSRNWRCIGFRTYAEALRREVGQSLGILRNQSLLC